MTTTFQVCRTSVPRIARQYTYHLITVDYLAHMGQHPYLLLRSEFFPALDIAPRNIASFDESMNWDDWNELFYDVHLWCSHKSIAIVKVYQLLAKVLAEHRVQNRISTTEVL
jgi:hypothetical protein